MNSKIKFRIAVISTIIQVLKFIKSFFLKGKGQKPFTTLNREVVFMTRELRKKLTLYLNIATLILFIINLTRKK